MEKKEDQVQPLDQNLKHNILSANLMYALEVETNYKMYVHRIITAEQYHDRVEEVIKIREQQIALYASQTTKIIEDNSDKPREEIITELSEKIGNKRR